MVSIVGIESIAVPQQNINPQQAQWMQQYQIPPIQQQPQHLFIPGHHQVQQPFPMESAYFETPMTMYPAIQKQEDESERQKPIG